MTAKPPPEGPASPGAPATTAVRRIKIEDLLDGAREMILVHAGQDYRLRITSKGKLILTK